MIRSAVIFFVFSLSVTATAAERIRVGSKNFTEGYIIAEILAQKLEQALAGTGVAVERRFGLGGTGIVYQALINDEIDIYPEYTGTLATAILRLPPNATMADLRKGLRAQRVSLSAPLGFDNSYALAMRREQAEQLGIRSISDLRKVPGLRMAFSYEFMERADGFPALIKHYGLKPSMKQVRRMDHGLVYEAISAGRADVIEVYTTDSKLEKLDLVILADDRRFFPIYSGVFLAREAVLEKYPRVAAALDELAGQFDNREVMRLNAMVELSQVSFAAAAKSFFGEDSAPKTTSFWQPIRQQTRRHLVLVFLPILAAILVGVPLGLLAAKVPALGQMILIVTGLLQTIPALALLCFLIPLFGIGLIPSLIALFLYSLLPIVRSAHSGITSLEPHYLEVARVLGLKPLQTLLKVELPLAAVTVLSGVKTAAVTSVGMATLAAFIGAGGYGALVVTGLALNDVQMILQGALPAAIMAVGVHFIFEFLDRWWVPKGLR